MLGGPQVVGGAVAGGSRQELRPGAWGKYAICSGGPRHTGGGYKRHADRHLRVLAPCLQNCTHKGTALVARGFALPIACTSH